MTNSTRNAGFSLIELMVGMLIAILASIVVYQVFAVSERQKRTTTGASDAQSNGAIAFYMVERDVKMAGWGLENTAAATCTTTFSYYEDGTIDCSTNDCSIPNLFSSVTLTDGAGGSPDSIKIKYFGNPDDPNYILPSLTTLRSTMPQSSSELNVSSTYGYEEGDLVLVIQNGFCTLMELTQVQPEALKLQHNPGSTPTYNPSIPYQTAHNWKAYTTGAFIQSASDFFYKTYEIQNRNLILKVDQPKIDPITGKKDGRETPSHPISQEIIDLQAEYGIAPVGSQQVNEWKPATGAWAGSLLTGDSYRIKAIRIALVARSSQYEKPDASGVCATTTDAMAASWSPWATFNTANYPADWKCYRYKVFETVIPIRNVIWANV